MPVQGVGKTVAEVQFGLLAGSLETLEGINGRSGQGLIPRTGEEVLLPQEQYGPQSSSSPSFTRSISRFSMPVGAATVGCCTAWC
jgi:hypothetical protein